jgi:hypothetical protein
MLVAALSAMAVLAIAVSAASAVEAPYYKVSGARLGAGESKEVLVEGEGAQVLNNATSKITITCRGLKAKAGALIIGSQKENAKKELASEPGTSSGTLAYTNCSTAGNGEACELENGALTTEPLRDELAYAVKQEPLVKGNKIVDLFTPASGSVFAILKFTAQAGHKCIFTTAVVEGSILVEIQNSKKETVAVEEHEAEEEFGFIKPIAGEACKVKEGKYTECRKATLKVFGTAESYAGTFKVKLPLSKELLALKFGAFSK